MTGIGKRIRVIRKKRGLSQFDLAEGSGVSRSYIADLERGMMNNPSLDVIQSLAAALHVSVSELLGEDAANSGAGL